MNFDQQQYLMQQGQRIQAPRLMQMSSNMGQQHMQTQQRFGMTMGQPNQQAVQLAPGQYMQAVPMQPRAQISFTEALSRLPPEAQAQAQRQLSAETNPERKRAIAMNLINSHRMRMSSNFPGQATVSGSAMMVNMSGGQSVQMTQGGMGGGQMIRMTPSQAGMSQAPIYQSQHQMQQQNMHMLASGQVSIPRASSHGYLQSCTTSPNALLQTTTAAHDHSNTALPSYSSPQPINIAQPSSVGAPAIQQMHSLQQKGPSSVPSALYTQHHRTDTGATSTHSNASSDGEKASSEEPLYSQMLEQLKTYHEHVKRMVDRNRLDGQPTKQIYERLLEIMENRRRVDLKLIEKLIGSVKLMVERSSLCHPLMEVVQTDLSVLPPDAFKTPFPDPWADFRQYTIKVPDEVLTFINDTEKSNVKRSRSTSGMDKKRLKKEGFDDANSDDKCTANYQCGSSSCIVVDCLDGSQLELSQEASDQLRNHSFRFDPEMLPISNECEEALVFIENDSLLVPPLRLIIPVNYPERGASVWQDRWSFDGANLTDINVQMEKRMAMSKNKQSISEIIKAWKVASEHVLRIGGGNK